jgi:glycosyltransferase involved in cell wall biosynthesis
MSSTFGPSVDPNLLPLRHSRAPASSLRIAIDLSLLRPRGENGGIKPFAFEYIRELARIEGEAVTFVFLTWSCSHDEVRALARPHDELVCVRHTDDSPLSEVSGWREGEVLWLNPPPTLLVQLKVSLLYAPLGSAEFACPGVPLVVTVADVLHRDYPLTLEPHVVAHRESVFQDLVKVADRYQCISSHTASRLIELFGVDPARAFRTYIVIQERLDCTKASGDRPIPEQYFFFPANAWQHKNHKTLLVAYRLYRHLAGPGAWELVLTGHDDDAMRGVLAAAQSLGIAEHVRFFGHLSDTEFAAVWRHAGAMVFPSLHEGFGIPLL